MILSIRFLYTFTLLILRHVEPLMTGNKLLLLCLFIDRIITKSIKTHILLLGKECWPF